MSSLTCETTPAFIVPLQTPARRISADEILNERTALREHLGTVPHGSGTGWSSIFWISCDCPACRDKYDPTGEESAKYLNMDYPSFFNGQSEMPSFAFSKIAKESYLANAGTGFYIGNAKKAATLEDVVLVMTPPLALRPARILHISENHTWDEFILSEDKRFWRRRTYIKGRSVWYANDEDQAIPFADLARRLQELFGV